MNIRTLLVLISTAALFATGCEKQKVLDKQKLTQIIIARTLGLAYLEENQLKEAEAEFRKVIELAPKEALGFANVGLVYFRKGLPPEAEEWITKALAIVPDNPDIRLLLASVYEAADRENEARQELEQTLKNSPDHARTLYNLAALYLRSNQKDAPQRAEEHLNKLAQLAPANIVVRLQLIETLLGNGKAGEAVRHLEALRQQMPELPGEAAEFYDKALAGAQANQAEAALTPARIFHNTLKSAPLYQAGILELRGPGGPLIGFPILNFSQDISAQLQEQKAVPAALRFTEVPSAVGLDVVKGSESEPAPASEPGTHLAVADYDGDGDQDLYVGSWEASRNQSKPLLFKNDSGKFIETSSAAGIVHAAKETGAIFADYDNDGRLDMYLTADGPNILYRNLGNGKFLEVTKTAGIGGGNLSYAARFVDLDHDGDLDLFLAHASANRIYRNNGDGTFKELAEKMNLAGKNLKSREVEFGDFDDDGDVDLFVANENAGNILYTNLRQGQFQDLAASSGLASDKGSVAVTAGDYNNDGFLDLFVTGLDRGSFDLYRNKGNGTFEKDTRSQEMLETLREVIGLDADFFDFDNDGFLDLLIAGKTTAQTGRGVFLFHNDGAGEYKDASSLLPNNLSSGRGAALADYDDDGDLDVFIAGSDGRVHLLRNDGGNVNHYLKIQLVGLRTGSSKNNHFAIGAKLEVWAGDLHQTRVVTDPVSHFGLGRRSKAEVARILWPNGVPQNSFDLASDRKLVEEQILKGSCAFLYTWNGREYTFVTDMMWRSALGMPLGIMGGSTAYAFPDASQEYLKISGNLLKAKAGKYTLQITEELWETAYFDQVKLLAIDHPDSVDIYVDERFVPPPYPPLRIYQVRQKHLPQFATDEQGNDLLPALRAKDEVYASNLKPGRYQGVTAMHDLFLDLGNVAQGDGVILFLNGWIFPSDASINVAITQSGQPKVISPYLQVRNRQDEWQTVIENMSFPAGKNKIAAVDLRGKFLSGDHRVRIRTNMEIYWDHIFFSTGEAEIPLRQTTLRPVAADIHYRGFSRMYRKGGRYGPHWFDYQEVSTEPKWRDLEGFYTRYGDVLPLLLEADDEYVIINSGDEVTVEFDATSVPSLQPGWRRDYLIYSNGWIKDGDLNTAHGKTVEPLPFHRMSRYPYGEDESYPKDEAHQEYLRTYNTRKVSQEKFKTWLLNPDGPGFKPTSE
ncbi:FG-GAP-like repeat-containing protein [candidate division KSB1 bacterium]|nr:FG-GAP-like repeat-containing protein [candidate division KSB1 bacterium]